VSPLLAGARRLPLLAVALTLVVVLAACGSDDSSSTSSSSGTTAAALDPAKPVTVTVGVPRSFGYLSTLWARNVQPAGVKVEYKYFPKFVDMLTALNAGKIDLTEIGDVGAVQSYVNGGKVQAIGVTQPNAKNLGLLVPKNSTATSIADLKGKKIAFLKSTNSYTAFLHQIKAAGLKESDFDIVEISGPDANKAFQTGAVDALWSIDPNMADLVEQTGGKVIANGDDAGVENLYPYVATTDAIKNKPAALGAVLQAVADGFPWIKANPDEQAKLLAPKLGFSESSIKTTYARGAEALQQIGPAFYAREQKVIDELVAAKIVTKPVKADQVFLSSFNQDTTAK
jgi:sulfonate transport system substrate-binding protein